jgi:hypothetical protein
VLQLAALVEVPHGAAMQQTKERSILDPLPVVEGSEAERWRRFGHVWQWWSLDPALKDYFTELG